MSMIDKIICMDEIDDKPHKWMSMIDKMISMNEIDDKIICTEYGGLREIWKKWQASSKWQRRQILGMGSKQEADLKEKGRADGAASGGKWS